MTFFEPTDKTALTTAFPNLPFRLRISRTIRC